MLFGVFLVCGFFVCLLGGPVPVTGFTGETIDQFEGTNRSKPEVFESLMLAILQILDSNLWQMSNLQLIFLYGYNKNIVYQL